MCATQKNINDNPELWDIHLSSWLFCELTRQLCPCLAASSCYFFASHTMHMENFLQALAGRLPVTKPCTSDQRLGRLPTGNRNRTCVRITARKIAIASDYSLAAQRFTSVAFATSRAAAVSHTRKHRTGATCVQRHKLYTKVIAAYDPNTNQFL